MKRSTSTVSFLLILSCAVPVFLFGAAKPRHSRPRVKHIIFMLPDGMGLADVTAARMKKNGAAGAPLALETLSSIGYRRTYSQDSAITDSAAAASAMACGEKFANGEVCLHADGRGHNPSILDLAKAKGWATGLVATTNLTDASPAAFAAHVRSRSCEKEIARQYVEQTRPDVMLGGGMDMFVSTVPDKCGTSGDFATKARTNGYQIVNNQQELNEAVSKGANKILGLFNTERLTPDFQRSAATKEPRLSEMTRAALAVVEKSKTGFFLFIEGSQIDVGNHRQNLDYQYSELAAFDDAVKVVLDWIDADPQRKKDTLLIVAPDHETGGFAIGGGEDKTLGAVKDEWTTTGHTGTDVLTWSQGPGSESLRRALDNTDVYAVMKNVLGAAKDIPNSAGPRALAKQ